MIEKALQFMLKNNWNPQFCVFRRFVTLLHKIAFCGRDNSHSDEVFFILVL